MKQSLLYVLFLFASTSCFGQVPSFPCAEGFGAKAIGGRGGKVIYVTNLNDSGQGSFRAACEASGARTVLFKVSGLISLKSRINIANPYLTIAGQTAPGDGICIRGGQLSVNTHDVIVRYIRSRAGDNAEYDSGVNPDNRDCFEIQNETTPPYNVIFDHCSASWGIDETMSTWFPCKDITIQWCMIAEALHNSLHTKGPHGKGLLIGDGARNISVHHNLFAYNYDRNPMIKGSTSTEILNNVMVGWGSEDYNAIYIGLLENEGHTPLQPTYSNMIGNTLLAGAASFNTWGIRANGNMDPSSKLFIKDNIGAGRPLATDPELNILRSRDRTFAVNAVALNGSSVTIASATNAYDEVLENAGANYPKRDAVDTRIANNVKNGTGKIINSQTEVGGWPVYSSTKAPTDTDNDGMPDDWEKGNKLNMNDANDGNSIAASGYTMLEEYINSLVSCANAITNIENNTSNAIHISLHPNPTKTELFVSGNFSENSNYEITSIEGKALQAGVVSGGNINIENLRTGIYIIKIKTEVGEKVQRFVKE
jgi:pectate lyase